MDEIMDQETQDQLASVIEKGCDFYKEALKVPDLAFLITKYNSTVPTSSIFMISYCGLEDIAAEDRAFNEFTAKKYFSDFESFE